MAITQTHRSQVARRFVEHARRHGVEAQCASKLSFDTLVELGDELADATDAPFFGLEAAAALPRGAYGIVEYAVGAAATADDAFETGVRYHALNSEASQLAVRREGATVTLEHWVDHPASARATHANEFAIGAFASLGARILGRRPPLRHVRFMHHASAERREALAHYFGAPVETAARRNALVFDIAVLRAPIAGSDPALFAILTHHAERDIASLPRRGDLAAQIRETYRRLLVEAPSCTQAYDVARAMAFSTRSFNRKLAALGTSFRAIEADVKHELARGYLRDAKRSVAEVARLVGFRAPSAFVRACRRWSGMTPDQLRRAL